MSRRARPHGPGKRTALGLSEREQAFALERRKDPTSPGWIIAQRAGFLGSSQKLSERARLLMKKPAIMGLVCAPADRDPLDNESGELDDEKLLVFLKYQLLKIVRGGAADKDKLSAIDKLIATVPGGYAPLQVDAKGKITMEMLVRAMGGAPEEQPNDPKPLLPKGADA